jgi:hypothetical protein
MSARLDIEDVRTLARGPNHGAFTSVGLKERIRTTDRLARALMAHGYLKTEVVVNPVNRCPTVIVSAEEVEPFERKYVSLLVLARQQGRHFLAVKKELDAAGSVPALATEKIGAPSYFR